MSNISPHFHTESVTNRIMPDSEMQAILDSGAVLVSVVYSEPKLEDDDIYIYAPNRMNYRGVQLRFEDSVLYSSYTITTTIDADADILQLFQDYMEDWERVTNFLQRFGHESVTATSSVTWFNIHLQAIIRQRGLIIKPKG